MKFKQWLLNEISNIVQAKELNQDKIRLYHGTSTGENNERIESFKKEGAKPIGGGHGQGGGFFVGTKLEQAKQHSIQIIKKQLKANIAHSGKPMVVIIEMPEMDFKLWDLDIEANLQSILTYASRKLEKMPDQSYSFKHSDKTKQYLDADKYQKNFEGEKFQIGGTEDYGKVKFHKGVPSLVFGTALLDPRRSKEFDISDINTFYAAKVARAYYGHQDQSQGRHDKLEAWFFKKYHDKKDLSLKYVGNKPLPVSKILVFDKNEWKSVYKR